MAEQTYIQEFEGYWVERKIQFIPDISGVYFVYECDENEVDNTVFLKRLIYIGESDNVQKRITNHEKSRLWKSGISEGSSLCFSLTRPTINDRFRLEAAFINAFQPPINTEYKDRFPFDKTIVKLKGAIDMLNDFIVVNRRDF